MSLKKTTLVFNGSVNGKQYIWPDVPIQYLKTAKLLTAENNLNKDFVFLDKLTRTQGICLKFWYTRLSTIEIIGPPVGKIKFSYFIDNEKIYSVLNYISSYDNKYKQDLALNIKKNNKELERPIQSLFVHLLSAFLYLQDDESLKIICAYIAFKTSPDTKENVIKMLGYDIYQS